jgi:hypothetical protein
VGTSQAQQHISTQNLEATIKTHLNAPQILNFSLGENLSGDATLPLTTNLFQVNSDPESRASGSI